MGASTLELMSSVHPSACPAFELTPALGFESTYAQAASRSSLRRGATLTSPSRPRSATGSRRRAASRQLRCCAATRTLTRCSASRGPLLQPPSVSPGWSRGFEWSPRRAPTARLARRRFEGPRSGKAANLLRAMPPPGICPAQRHRLRAAAHGRRVKVAAALCTAPSRPSPLCEARSRRTIYLRRRVVWPASPPSVHVTAVRLQYCIVRYARAYHCRHT